MKSKVLIVDDNLELLKLLRLSFASNGFCVATASNGVDAVKKSRSFAPDAVVLDLILPRMDGFAVCETLRESAGTASVPILILTGLTSQLARFSGLDSGANELMTKPVRPSDLVARLKGLLQQRHKGKAARRPRTKTIPARIGK